MKSFLEVQLAEVLSKDADAGTWIDDFVKSDDPKFAGKSAEKRKQMALAAYYAKQKNESVETPEQEKARKELDLKLSKWKNQQRAAKTEGVKQVRGDDSLQYEEYHVVGNNSYYGDKQEPVKLSSHKSKEEAQAALAKHKSASNTERGNRSKWHKVVDDSGLKKHMDEDISIDEAIQSHKIGVTVSDPNHQAVSQRKEKMQKSVIVKATDKGEAQAKAEAFYKKKGYKVHDSFHHSVVPATSMKTEAIELDELSNKLLNRYSKKAEKEAGKHFMAADRAQDRGNYDKAQTNMDKAEKRASGVYRAQSKIKEESLDEISKDTLSSYAHKAFAQGNDLHYDLAHSKGDKATDAERQAIKDKISKRNAGVIKASQKMNKEDMELHEDAYDAGYSHGGVGKPKSNPHTPGTKSHKHYEDGYDQGKSDKETNEAVDTVKKDASGKVIAWSHEGDWEKQSTKNKQGSGKAANLAGKAMQKTKQLSKEEVEEIDEKAAAGDWHVHDSKTDKIHSTYSTHRKAINAMNKLNSQHDGYETPGGITQSKFAASAASYHKEDLDESAWGRDKMASLRQAHDRHMEKALAANKAGDDTAVKTHQRKMQMIQGKMQKLKQNEEVELGEECDILVELSKNTLKSYVGKAVQSHGSNRVIANMAWDKSEKPGDLLDKLGHKSLKDSKKRSIGIAKAVNKLTKEEVEEFMQTEAYDQLDELDKKTLGNYIAKAHDQLMKHTSSVATKYARGDRDAMAYALDDTAVRKTANRTKGAKQAISKLTKEDTDTMLTYSEFMAQLAEGKADDLRDKLAADRERRLDKYDYSKEKDSKVSPVKNVKGHSYGAGEDSEEGEDEVKTAKPAAVKRGRGRPAGSKSGARV